jgi:hypothetical protein
MAGQKLYLYLARRDRTGIKLLSVLPTNNSVPPTRLKDIKSLNLPIELTSAIQQTIHTDRMLFEPWIQTASNYNEFKESLKKRKYKNIPANMLPIHEVRPVFPAQNPKTSQLSSRRTMLRRASRIF